MTTPTHQSEGEPAEPQEMEELAEPQEMEPAAKPSVSDWRLPSNNHKLPSYIKQKFRLKAFLLLTVQFAVVFVIVIMMKMVDESTDEALSNYVSEAPTAAMLFAGFPTLVSLLVLQFMSRTHPINYALLIVATLLLGIFWGVAGLIRMVPLNVHYLLTGTPMVALPAAAGFFVLLSRILTSARQSVVLSLLLGWVVGSVSTVAFGMAFLDVSADCAWIAAVGTLVLFTLLILTVGNTLVRCNPDDFLKIVIAADSVLLVVGAPLFFFLFWVNICHEGGDDEQERGMGVEPS
jgi:hypothetical protein